jgi:hypothetical protein
LNGKYRQGGGARLIKIDEAPGKPRARGGMRAYSGAGVGGCTAAQRTKTSRADSESDEAGDHSLGFGVTDRKQADTSRLF